MSRRMVLGPTLISFVSLPQNRSSQPATTKIPQHRRTTRPGWSRVALPGRFYLISARKFQATSVPEPATLTPTVIGAFGLLFYRWRRPRENVSGGLTNRTFCRVDKGSGVVFAGWVRDRESLSGEDQLVAGATCPRSAGLGRVAASPWCRLASITATRAASQRRVAGAECPRDKGLGSAMIHLTGAALSLFW